MIRTDVIAKYAGSMAVECFGIVGMASVSMKDGLVHLLKKDSITRGINVSLEDNELTIDFHVIVSYGVSILAVYNNLTDSVKFVDIIRENFDLRPAGIIKMLDLRRPIYAQTAAYGHFGRTDIDLPWEKTDKAEVLKKYLA